VDIKLEIGRSWHLYLSYFIPKGMDVRGGIRMGLVDNHLRIDNNQHGMIALMRAIEAYDRLAARGELEEDR